MENWKRRRGAGVGREWGSGRGTQEGKVRGCLGRNGAKGKSKRRRSRGERVGSDEDIRAARPKKVSGGSMGEAEAGV